jgi:PAS domain S-box-containing protein
MNGHTSQILKDSSQTILSQWENEVRKRIPAAQYESKLALRDSIPDFLQDLILALETNFSEHTDDFLQFAHKHGRERANDSSYSIEDAITEYNILRKVVFNVLESKGEVPARDRDIIYEAISLALAKAGAEFAKTQIREVKTLHTRLQVALEAADIGIFSHDLQSDIVEWSEKEAVIFGLEPSMTILPFNEVKKIFHPEDWPEIKEKIAICLSNERNTFKHQFRLVHPGGKIRWVKGVGQAIRDQSGKVTHFIGTNIDLTDEKKKIDELRKEQELREKFVSTLSHDLRTPLTASKMSAQIIARKITDTAIHTHTTRIVDNINRADKLIQDLLDASKIRAGKMSLPETKEFDLVHLIHTTLDDLTTIHGERFSLTGPRKLDVNLHQDGIRRILENLCSNAIKYGSTHDQVKIKIEKLGEHFAMSVCNTGNPLIHIDREKLFEPFEQFHGSSKSGWGIGLTIVKGITEAHGGTVRVESDKSTVFTVNLPINAAPFIEDHLH